KRPQLPIIMLSGYASQVPPSVKSMVDVFLQKGEKVDSLFAEIERLIGPGGPSLAPTTLDDSELMDHIRSLPTQNGQAIAKADELIARNRSAERRSRKPEEY